MLTNELYAIWDNFVDNDKSTIFVECLEHFAILVKPYTGTSYLRPSERREIILDLEESLTDECKLTENCTKKNIKYFCHTVAYNVLDMNKLTPKLISPLITALKIKK